MRTLNDSEKAEYIRAVKCTQSLPNITSFAGVQNRFDDFQAVHINTADLIHYVGHFLPWHRRFVSIYETTLRTECDYKGSIPYWDWTQDVKPGGNILNSPIFDPVTGFGGDGVPGTYDLPDNLPDSSSIMTTAFVGCVMDGPFSRENFIIHLGPGRLITSHCLVRGVDNKYDKFLNSEAVGRALSQPTFEKFRVELEGTPSIEHPNEHGSGHLVIGGDLSNLYSSPGDPIFFLHHSNLDRLWWSWEMMDPLRRLDDMSGKTVKSKETALEFLLHYDALGNTIPIRDVMDIRDFPLCYVYE
ncbi:tyrosinase [Gymnopilus junonius]|uniref:Tyrosinase n=1 Tax=Gymnopilus junonius TaxID=109634 RepID=A0A9P5NUM8_GYMJU|nr:tyrosinase [Gymnopilus junonius]